MTVSPATRTATINVTNTFPDFGGFTVTKHVTGETGGYVAGSTFSVAYSCSGGLSGTLTLTDGQTKARVRPAHRHHLHPVGGGQAGHQRRQLRVGHRDLGPLELGHHRGQQHQQHRRA